MLVPVLHTLCTATVASLLLLLLLLLDTAEGTLLGVQA